MPGLITRTRIRLTTIRYTARASYINDHSISSPRRNKLGLAIAALILSATVAALWSAAIPVFAGANSQIAPREIGRGFTALITSIDGKTISVDVKGVDFDLVVTTDTAIHAPPDKDVGIEVLSADPPSWIAVLAQEAVTGPDGTVSVEPVASKIITVIPAKSTRKHLRVITTDKTNGRLKAVDTDGKEREITGGPSADVAKGEDLVLIIQLGERPGAVEKINTFLKSDDIDTRLENLLGVGDVDPLRKARLEVLKEKREAAKYQRLNETAINASSGISEFVQTKITDLRDQRAARGGPTGISRDVSECARSLLGRQVGRFADLTPEQQGQVKTQCLQVSQAMTVNITAPSSRDAVIAGSTIPVSVETSNDAAVGSVTFTINGARQPPLVEAPFSLDIVVPADSASLEIGAAVIDNEGNTASTSVTIQVTLDQSPVVSITAPREGVPLSEGELVTISAAASDNRIVASVVFEIGGRPQSPITTPPYSFQFRLPAAATGGTPPPLVIVVTVTDDFGNTASDSLTLAVGRNRPPTVSILEPTGETEVIQGETITILAEAEDDGAVASVTFSIDGQPGYQVTRRPFSIEYKVPGGGSSAVSSYSPIPPHVFVGSATIDGTSAPDGTVVTAWVTGGRTSSLQIEATAEDNNGKSGRATITVPVVQAKIKAGKTNVADGQFIVIAQQPSGESFAGREVTFTIGGLDVPQSGVWQQGGGDVLNLAASR